jgi:hypothetical protein
MTDQLGEEVPPETARAWDSVRRVREPLAWALLVIAAIAVLVSAWQLFGLPGAPVATGPSPVAVVSAAPVTVAPVTAAPSPVPVVPAAPVTAAPSPVAVTAFGFRASVVAPQFVSGSIFTLPVLAVILVAFAGGRTDRARQVVQAAVSVLAVALVFGLLSWLAALGAHVRHGVWFIFDAIALAAVAAALIFTVAVFRSQALQPLRPQLADAGEDGEDFGEDA